MAIKDWFKSKEQKFKEQNKGKEIKEIEMVEAVDTVSTEEDKLPEGVKELSEEEAKRQIRKAEKFRLKYGPTGEVTKCFNCGTSSGKGITLRRATAKGQKPALYLCQHCDTNADKEKLKEQLKSLSDNYNKQAKGDKNKAIIKSPNIYVPKHVDK